MFAASLTGESASSELANSWEQRLACKHVLHRPTNQSWTHTINHLLIKFTHQAISSPALNHPGPGSGQGQGPGLGNWLLLSPKFDQELFKLAYPKLFTLLCFAFPMEIPWKVLAWEFPWFLTNILSLCPCMVWHVPFLRNVSNKNLYWHGPL